MEIHWHPNALEFAEIYHLDKRLVEDAVRSPTSEEDDPYHEGADYPVKRVKRGDLSVTVGWREPNDPMILFIHLTLPGEQGRQRRSVGGTQGSSLPPTIPELHRRIVALGYSITTSGPHAKVRSREGAFIYTMPRTPSDKRSIANSWKGFERAHADYLASKENP